MRHRSPWSTPAGRNPTRRCPTQRWAGSFFAILHPVEDECHQPGGDGGTVSLNAGSAVADVTPPAISWRYRWRSVAFAPVGNGIRRRRGSDGLRLVAAATSSARLPPDHQIRLSGRQRYHAGGESTTGQYQLAGDPCVRRWRLWCHGSARRSGARCSALRGRPRHRPERGRYRLGVRSFGARARHRWRPGSGNGDPRLQRPLPGVPDRRLHGRRHRQPPVPGQNAAAIGGGLRRPCRPGLGRRWPRLAAQRHGEHGHRLGRHRHRPLGLRIASGAPVDR